MEENDLYACLDNIFYFFSIRYLSLVLFEMLFVHYFELFNSLNLQYRV